MNDLCGIEENESCCHAIAATPQKKKRGFVF